MKFSIPQSTTLFKREIALACIIILVHALLIKLVLHGTHAFGGKSMMVANPLASPVSVTLRTPPAITPSFSPQQLSKPHPDKRDNPAQRITSATNASAPQNRNAESAPQSKGQYNFSPPSSILQYDVLATRNGINTAGNAYIFWQNSHRAFSIQGEINLEQKNILAFNSEGVIDEARGISPTIYSEKRDDELPTNTHFHWDKKIASSSASNANHALEGHEQDRASIIWQLVRLGRQNSRLFSPNSQLHLTVVDSREGGAWSIRVIGKETLATHLGSMTTWHLALAPTQTLSGKTTELWLAPEQNWYPIKMRYTESNGDILELHIREISLTTES